MTNAISTHPDRSDQGSQHIGSHIGNWRLLRLLGTGAFGMVYEAEHQAIASRRAAVKILDRQVATQSELKRRFVNEASAASRVSHENIVQVFDGGVTEDGNCYVVMELLSGQSLAQLLRRGRLNVGRTINLGIQAAGALQAAHNVGIVHRDLKPENLHIVGRDHNPEFLKVLDFGIAKLRDAEGQTKAGIWLGTPGYMSPEQWQTIPDIDGRADIYALGVILHECVTGQLPFSGNTPYDWLNAHLTHRIPDPSSLAPMPPLLSQLIQRMLAKRREERPQSMGEVASELQRCAVVKGNPWLRLMAEETSPGRRASGPMQTLPLGQLEPAGGHSTLRQGLGEKVQGPPPASRSRALPYLAGALTAGLLCLAGVAGAYHRGWSVRPPAGPTEDDESAEPVQAHTAAKAVAVAAAAPAAPALAARAPAALRPPPPHLTPQLDELVIFGPGRLRSGHGRHRHAEASGPVGRFAIGRYAVTVGQYQAYAAATKQPPIPQPEGSPAASEAQDQPLTLVDREQAAAYCRWKYGRLGGRLPTESEWELAAGGAQSEHHRRHPSRRRHTSARRLASGSEVPGLSLVAGISEWTMAPAAARSPSGDSGAVVRGTVADGGPGRMLLPAGGRYPFVGFRCAAEPL